MDRHLAVPLFLVLLTTVADPLHGQDAPRPRIGLALSGGGARGFAHVGVLEWFEERRIPVHRIAGTSMGGLVGGLYAMGMEASEIRELTRRLDWDELLSTRPPYEDLILRRRRDREEFPSTIEFGWRGGLTVAEALVSGHSVRLVFDRLALPYGELVSFDDLPIPYRAVAVDLVSGERIVIADGLLSDALAATTAIPGIFRPVSTDGRLLVDGGLLDNLPTEVVDEMGADIVIAVDVSAPLRDRDELSSLFAVLDQSIGIMMLEEMRQSRQAADVVIAPKLEGFTAADFTSSEPIIESGRAAAESRAAVLSGLSLPPQEWAAHLEQRRRLRRNGLPVPTRLAVTAPRAENRRRIERELAPQLNRTVDPEALEEALDHVRGEGRLARLGYAVAEQSGEETLMIEGQSKGHGPPFINIAVIADNTETDDVSFSVAGRLTYLDLGRHRAEWRTDVSLGSRLAFFSEYYYPVEGGFFVAPRVFADRATVNLFRDGSRKSEYKQSGVGAGFDLGWGVGRRSDEVRLGFELSRADAEVRIGEPLLPDVSGTVSAASLSWRHDAADAAVVPRTGWTLDAATVRFFESPGSKTGFWQSQVKLAGFVPTGSRGSIVLRAAGGTTYGRIAPPLEQFTLGGPFRLGGLGAGELRGSRYWLLSPGYRQRLAELPAPLGGAVHAFVWYEAGSVFEPEGPRGRVHSGSIGLIAETLLGPVFVGGSWAEEGRNKLYISVGRVF